MRMKGLLGVLMGGLLLLASSAQATAILKQISPIAKSYVQDTDFIVSVGSGVGSAAALAEAIDWELGLNNASTSGCEASDFNSFTAGNIALIQRGACSFRDKVLNAIASGAIGTIIFNQGNSADRLAAFRTTLLSPPVSIPVLSASYDVGVELVGTSVQMSVPEPTTTALLALGLFGMGYARKRRIH